MLDFLIKNAVILTMDDAMPVVHGQIGIEGEFITHLSKEDNSAPLPPAREVIDANGNIIMPGLINTHAHAAMCIMRGYADDYALNEWLFNKIFPVEGRLTRKAVLAGVRLGVAEMLASGTTSFSDMYFFEPDAAEMLGETGIRASLSNGVIALGDKYDFESDRAVIETRALIKDYHLSANGRIRADAAIHGEYTSNPSVWHKVSSLAKEYDLVTQIHLSETKSEQTGSLERHSMTPTEVLCKNGVFDTRTLAAHGVWLTDEDIAILAEKKVSVAHNPVSNLKLASGIADIAKLMKHGVNVSLGTDGCASNNTHDLFEEIKLASLLAKGISLDPTVIPAYTALKMATINGAKAQGREKEVGMLAVGMQADVIMLNTDAPHLFPMYDPAAAAVFSARGSDVLMTMVQGKILYRNGQWLTIDIDETIDSVRRYALPVVLGQC